MKIEEIEAKIKALYQSENRADHYIAFCSAQNELGLTKRMALERLEPMIIGAGDYKLGTYLFSIGILEVEYEQVEDDMVFEIDHYIHRNIYRVKGKDRVKLPKVGKHMNGSHYNLRHGGNRKKAAIDAEKIILEDYKSCVPILLKLLDEQ